MYYMLGALDFKGFEILGAQLLLLEHRLEYSRLYIVKIYCLVSENIHNPPRTGLLVCTPPLPEFQFY